MSNGNPNKLLLILMGVVPLVVLLTVLAAFLLVRAGFGLLVGAGLPFVVSTIFIIALSVALGRAASGSGNPPEDPDERSEGRPRKRDGV